MTTIATNSHGSLNNVPRRSYIAMSSYTSDFFSYNLSFNNQSYSYVGTLSTIGVPATSTLQGSILSETGKKLYPGANDGVSTFMVSVYDQTSKLTGFINPNSPTFAIFNTDKPPYMGQGTDPGTDGRTNLGNSIYTHGSVIADGFGTYAGLLSTGTSLNVGTTARIGASLSTGTSAIIGTTLSVGQAISSGTLVIAPSTLTQNTTLSSYTAGYVTAGTGTLVSGALVINTSAVTANSKIFLTNTLATNSVRVGTIVANTSFQVLGTNVDTFTWLIIN
jgi:hypothetical protein